MWNCVYLWKNPKQNVVVSTVKEVKKTRYLKCQKSPMEDHDPSAS